MGKNDFLEATRFDDIKEIIYNSVKLYQNHVAFVTKEKIGEEVQYKNTTYKQLLEQINSLGTALYKLGLKGKRIAIFGRNRYEWALSHLSCLLGGIVSVPLDKDLQENELSESLKRSKADAIIFDEKYIDKIENIKNEEINSSRIYICMSKLEGFNDVYELISEGSKAIQEGYREYIDCKIDNKSMSILLFTSGTTSKSKAVMLSQYGIATDIYDMLLVEGLKETDVNIAFLPYHHVYGSTAILVMLSKGIKTVFTDGLRYIQANLKEYKVSVFVGVPLLVDKMYTNIQKGIEKKGKTKLIKFAKGLSKLLLKIHIDIRRKIFKQVIDELGGELRFIISGGAPLDPKIEEGFKEFGIHIVQGYGLTETSPVISSENDRYSKTGSVGIPMKNIEVKIENKDDNGIGEIAVKGPAVMLGYYENEEATKEVLKDGWFYTGDLGYLDKDGFLFITGRRKDVIVLKNGKKVFPEELETLVNRIPEIEECFVFGIPENDDKNDLKVSIKVVYNKEEVKSIYGDITKEELYKNIWEKIKETNKTLPKYKYIKNMILTDKELIKTSTKKIKRNEEMKLILKEEV